MLQALLAYLPQLGSALALELAVLWALVPAVQRRRALAVGAALNLFTHATWTLLLWNWSVLWFEIHAVLALMEFVGYRQLVPLGVVRALAAAFFANLLALVAAMLWWLLVMS